MTETQFKCLLLHFCHILTSYRVAEKPSYARQKFRLDSQIQTIRGRAQNRGTKQQAGKKERAKRRSNSKEVNMSKNLK